MRYYIDIEPDMVLVGEADCGATALKGLLALEISAQRKLFDRLLPGMLPVSRADNGVDDGGVDDVDVGCSVDVVVLDVSLPDSDTAHVCEKIRKRWPLTQVLVFSGNDDRGSLCDALASGALGYVLKRSSAEEFIRAIRAVAAGQTYIDPLFRARSQKP